MVDTRDPAVLNRLFREFVKFRDNCEEFQEIVYEKFSEQAEQIKRIETLQQQMQKNPPLSAVGYSTDSVSSIETKVHAAKRRLDYKNEEFMHRTPANIDQYLDASPSLNVLPPFLLTYSTHAKTLRDLSYQEFIQLEDVLVRMRKKRMRSKTGGMIVASDDEIRNEFLAYLGLYDSAVFDMEYVTFHMLYNKG